MPRGTRRALHNTPQFNFLLRDDFVHDAAAPLTSPRACDGAGTLTITDTNNKLSVVSGKLSFATGGVGAGNPGAWGSVLSAIAGRAVIGANVNGASAASGVEVGWDNAQSGGGQHVLRITATASSVRDTGTSISADTISANTNYHVASILRTNGFLALIKGGAFANWTLLWVGTTSLGAYYPTVTAIANTSVATVDSLRVLDLPAPFTGDYGLATQRTASPSANDTITSEANAVVEFTWTAVTGETVELSVRCTDDNNRWIVRGDQAGSTVKLIEVNAGVETERASAAQTWTNTTAYRIVVVQDGNTIRGYVANVLVWTYASASFNNTATGIKTNKAGTDLIAWPRTLSGTAATLLDLAVA